MFYILDIECCCHPILLIVEMIADDWERQFGIVAQLSRQKSEIFIMN